MKIVTSHVYPPIPLRNFDWAAYDDDTYDGPGSRVGSGPTEQAAIDDLLEQIEEHDGRTITDLQDLVERHSPSAVEGQAPTDEPTSKSAPRASDWINFLYGEQSEPDEERIEDYDE